MSDDVDSLFKSAIKYNQKKEWFKNVSVLHVGGI